ncbi:hypothetical protein GCM10022243_02450 [Saccharothrix violaceirubra]|uniref:DUF5313 domain-containing protein n=1 Tax=Saccharothrix violaceirubra TaxID=413306 RepID=A0A7W7WWH8_9PSEU|nr:DUF5313 family protein [Saccharothrix violaceirubra]MBB4966002.1 hypothetical protein [Saccharothrix violaceirubra]
MSTPAFPLRLWYLVGGRLSARHREWVFHEATKPSWLVWFTVRSFLQVLPLTIVIALVLVLAVGAPLPLALACGSLGLIVGVYFSLSYAAESTDHRLTKYGFPAGAGTEARRRRTLDQEKDRRAAYERAWREPS